MLQKLTFSGDTIQGVGAVGLAWARNRLYSVFGWYPWSGFANSQLAHYNFTTQSWIKLQNM